MGPWLYSGLLCCVCNGTDNAGGPGYKVVASGLNNQIAFLSPHVPNMVSLLLLRRQTLWCSFNNMLKHWWLSSGWQVWGKRWTTGPGWPKSDLRQDCLDKSYGNKGPCTINPGTNREGDTPKYHLMSLTCLNRGWQPADYHEPWPIIVNKVWNSKLF